MYWIQPTFRGTSFLVSFCTFYQRVRNWLSFWNCYGISHYFEIQNYYATTSTILDITICNQLDFDYELLHTDHIVWRTCKIFPCNEKFTGEIVDTIKYLKNPRENVEVTSVSKNSGQTIVLYHYCGVSRFFWNRR